MKIVERSVVSRGSEVESEEWIGCAQRSFSHTTQYDTVMLDICHYIVLSKHRIYHIKSEPWCKQWTQINNKSILAPHI